MGVMKTPYPTKSEDFLDERKGFFGFETAFVTFKRGAQGGKVVKHIFGVFDLSISMASPALIME